VVVSRATIQQASLGEFDTELENWKPHMRIKLSGLNTNVSPSKYSARILKLRRQY
jgi:hypothetical protein